MKRWPFYVIWGILLAVCIVFGAITRTSFIDIPCSGESFEQLQYNYYRYMEENPDVIAAYSTPASQVIADADCIILGTFTGNRQSTNKSFLCDFQVQTVLKGDSSLEKTMIAVYEPVKYAEYNVQLLPQANPEEWENLQKHFQIDDTNRYYLAGTQAWYEYGNTMMLTGETYVLLLDQRQYAQGMAEPSKLEFVPIESPYSKMNYGISVSAEDYQLPEPYLSVKDTAPYEILVTDLVLYEQFLKTKAEIFASLGLILS